MADFSWLDKLTPEQQAVANMVIDKAQSMGIDPRLALAIGMQESGFNPASRGEKGEIGVMQVRPTTGKEIGFSEEDLTDPAKNIDAGLKYLKQMLQKYPDPVDAVAAYNAGPNHPYFKDPDKNELPESTINHLMAIKNYGGFTTTPKEEDKKDRKKVEVSDEDRLLQQLEEMGFDKQRLTVDAIAALTGALVGGGVGSMRSAAERIFGSPAGAAGAAGPTAGSSGARWAAKTGYGLGEGTVRDVSERFKAAQPQPIGGGRVTSKIKAVPGTVAPLSINAIPPQLPPPPAPSMGRQMAQGAMQMGRAASRFPMAIPTGALSGLGAAELGMQAIDRYRTDPVGSAIAGIGAAGSAASLLPFAPAKVIGGGLAMASPAALYLLDKMRAGRQTPPPQQMADIVAP